MRFVNFAAILFAGLVIAKNVVYLDDLRAAVEESENQKREPKNVVSLEDLRAALDKQEEEAKETRDLDETKGFFRKLAKRGQDVIKDSAPLLQNLLPLIPSVSIFAGYLRDDQELLNQVENKKGFTILLAPTDNAMFDKLNGVKPWEFPKKIQYDQTDDEVVAYNINHFLKAHMLTQLGDIGENNKLTTVLLDGRDIVVEFDPVTKSHSLKIEGQQVPVASVTPADNGIVFVIDEVLSLP